ncbi:uncharacterized protein LOC141631744 [Silene latifolia]|uniref:uncharacterized protein LOC141631744 n=1 Tax=Silene latifolia TaxID=37657 RepID=UPI003D781357
MVDDKKTGETSHTPNPVYAVSLHDGTGAKITHVVLLGPNYEEWAKGFRVALGAKRKLGFIDGTLKEKPSDPKDVEDWTAINYLIVAWIFNTIDSRVRSSISYRETAFELWEDIRLRFTVGNEIKIYQIQNDLSECKQKPGETIMDYYGRMKKLWDDINDFDALPSCKCSGYRCDLNVVLRQRREADQVRGFLMGLEPFYATVRSQLLGTKPFPPIQLVYSQLVQEEEVRTLTQVREDATTPMAMAVRDGGKKQAKGKSRFKCTYCTKEGHTESRCWEKHGYPNDREPRRSASRDCSAANDSPKVNAILGEPEVITNMIRLNGKNAHSWIIDTGASTHVCGSDFLFESMHSIKPINVGLPNGTQLSAHKAGVVRIDNKLSIHNDHALTTIEVGDLTGGLYYLTMEEPTRVNAVAGNSEIELWHQRMGHPSTRAMEYLHAISSRNLHLAPCDSRDVRFIEHCFPFAANTGYASAPPASFDSEELFIDEEDLLHTSSVPAASSNDVVVSDINDTSNNNSTIDNNDNVDAIETPPDTETVHSNTDTEASEMGRGKRIKFDNTRNKDYVRWDKIDQHINTTLVSSTQSPTSNPVSGTPYPIANYVNCSIFSSAHQSFLAAITSDVEPSSFKEAICDSRWKKAMEEEIDALKANKTWSVVDLPPNKSAIGCMWVYKIKRKSDGSIERYKARLVVFGNHQVEGIDFVETFAPTVKMVTVRTFLALAAINNWELHQMDVQNAFLHGDLSEEVYMRLPPGFSHGLQGKVCRLQKSLYGLRQSPRCWYAKLATALCSYGFSHSSSDHSLFIYRKDSIVINILVYVDDLVIAGNDNAAITDFKHYLNKCFRMKDLGTLKYFLGLEVARNLTGIFLCQRKYTLDLLSETGILGAKPSTLPIEENHQLALSLTRRSLTAYFVFVGGSPILWKTKKQATVSRSSAEAEYRAMASATCEILWLKGLLRSLGVEHPKAVSLECDSQAALHIANNPVFHKRTKHIEIDCHFVRDEILRGTILPSYINTTSQLADILTKALGRSQFLFLLGKLGISNLHAPT